MPFPSVWHGRPAADGGGSSRLPAALRLLGLWRGGRRGRDSEGDGGSSNRSSTAPFRVAVSVAMPVATSDPCPALLIAGGPAPSPGSPFLADYNSQHAPIGRAGRGARWEGRAQPVSAGAVHTGSAAGPAVTGLNRNKLKKNEFRSFILNTVTAGNVICAFGVQTRTYTTLYGNSHLYR